MSRWKDTKTVARWLSDVSGLTRGLILLKITLKAPALIYGWVIFAKAIGYGAARPRSWPEAATGCAIGLLLAFACVVFVFHGARRWRRGWLIAAATLQVFGLAFAVGYGYQTWRDTHDGNCPTLVTCSWVPLKEALVEIIDQ
ncbi:MAG: hypothetical protein H6707_04165 [Deltaproteobacteria bacterium]|nr:hypothetical protein [Deltaproteobacteria bacterium]